jgi:pilus assembly protein CpaF
MFGKRQTSEVIPFAPDRASQPVETPEPVGESVNPSSQAIDEAGDLAIDVAIDVAFDQFTARDEIIEKAVAATDILVASQFSDVEVIDMARGKLAAAIEETIEKVQTETGLLLDEHEQRDAITVLINKRLDAARKNLPKADVNPDIDDPIQSAKEQIQPLLMERIDVAKASEMPRNELAAQITEVVAEILAEEKMQLNLVEQRSLITKLLNDMLGLGPLEPLLDDETITDIMVNGPKQVFIEQGGKLVLADVQFRDNAHVMNIAQRIVSGVGRRVDESSPLVDARLMDGSRVNIIIPPLAIDGPTISIRKFSEKKITLDVMAKQGNISDDMSKVLKIASRSRLNILISGGTGSGKTTLLNALSQMIDHGERVVTIEDAAELQLQQPHVVRLETRPPNLEGGGEISQTDLVKNALRMRPDRIILGEIRGGEAMDMLQAMNTGHDGSLGTVHANNPREALTRLENMVAMSGVKLPNDAVRAQIAGAVHMIVQISRMRDGMRRITHITEIIGMEGEVITTQDLYTYKFKGEGTDGKLLGEFESASLRPNFTERASYFGLDKSLLEVTL